MTTYHKKKVVFFPIHKEGPVILKKIAHVSSKVLHSSYFSVLSPHRGGGFVVSDGEYKS